MPLYEYQCDACGHRFEALQKFSDPPLESCPKCGQPVRKLIAAPAFQLKGTGWYVTDFAKKDAPAKSPANTSAETPKDGSAAPAKSEGTSASAPAATPSPGGDSGGKSSS